MREASLLRTIFARSNAFHRSLRTRSSLSFVSMNVIYRVGRKIGIIGIDREHLARWIAFGFIAKKSRLTFTFQPCRQGLLLRLASGAPLLFNNLKQHRLPDRPAVTLVIKSSGTPRLPKRSPGPRQVLVACYNGPSFVIYNPSLGHIARVVLDSNLPDATTDHWAECVAPISDRKQLDPGSSELPAIRGKKADAKRLCINYFSTCTITTEICPSRKRCSPQSAVTGVVITTYL